MNTRNMTMLTTTMEKTAIKPTKQVRIPTPAFKVGMTDSGERVIQDIHADVLEVLQDHVRSDDLYGKSPSIKLTELFDSLTDLRDALSHSKSRKLKTLINYVESEFKEELTRTRHMHDQGVTNFYGIKHLFPVGTPVYMPGEHAQAGTIKSCELNESMFGAYWTIEMQYITSSGTQFQFTHQHVHISGFPGVLPLRELPLQLLDADLRAQLHARGEIYSCVAIGAHYQYLTGHMDVQKWWRWSQMRAQGRCMVDIQTHDQFAEQRGYRDRDQVNTTLTPDMWWQTDAHVRGFSFVTKQWGRFPVANLSHVQFRKDAYDQLVLEDTKKVMIRSLVQHSHNNFEDIISGKGGGCIFLLHGEPGVGKTLTAEAVSELLERPLYSVSVGELGTDPQSMEKNMRQILDVAQIWNAVILLDEADIFLEKRTTGDILRNAMIGILLKLLEYHQGVMFLTTNRVAEFDTAFYSRISVALRYDALDDAARAKVWRNLLDAAGLTHVMETTLSAHVLNGRQIKNVIRLSMSLAQEQQVPVSVDLVDQCVRMSQAFLNAPGCS